MNPEVKANWIKALKSGKYKQGKERLRVGDDFCCLGVLCDLFQKKRKKKMWTVDGCFRSSKYTIDSNYLPSVVVDWAGLNENDPMVTEFATLSRMNDEYSTSFSDLADIIEKNL